MNLSCSQFFSNHSETETENKLEILEETTNHTIEINPEEFDPHTKPEAKTIEASDISAHPHLEPYKGLILLSNLKTHIVFLGIPSTPSPDRWNQRIAVIFIKNDHLWQKVEDIKLISVMKSTKAHGHFTPIALDFGLDRKNYGYVKILYASNNGEGLKTSIMWTLHPEESVLSLITHNLTTKAAKTSDELWKVRLQTSKTFELHSTESKINYAYGQLKSLPVIVGAFNSIGKLKFSKDSYTIEPKLGKSILGLNGIFIILGSWRAQKGVSYLDVLEQCDLKHKNTDLLDYSSEDKFHLLENCLILSNGYRSPL